MIAPRPAAQAPAVDFDDAGCEPLEKGAIVGNEQHAAGKGAYRVLEPIDGVEIEVIGGFVEEQQIGTADQRARKPHAALPAPGQITQTPLCGQLELAHDPIGLGIDVPTAMGLDVPLQRLQRGQTTVIEVACGELVVFADQPAVGLEAAADEFVHTAVARPWQHLLELTDLDAAAQADIPAIGLQRTDDESQQRRLARTVSAYEAYALTRADGEFCVAEYALIAEFQTDVVEGDECHGCSCRKKVGGRRCQVSALAAT